MMQENNNFNGSNLEREILEGTVEELSEVLTKGIAKHQVLEHRAISGEGAFWQITANFTGNMLAVMAMDQHDNFLVINFFSKVFRVMNMALEANKCEDENCTHD